MCIAVAQSTCIINNEGTMVADDINFNCQGVSECDSNSGSPTPGDFQAVSSMNNLLDGSRDGIDVGGGGTGGGGTGGGGTGGGGTGGGGTGGAGNDSKKKMKNMIFFSMIAIILIGILLY
jgi:hypothetical protein